MSAAPRFITAAAMAAALIVPTVAGAADASAGCLGARGLDLPITIYNQSSMTGSELDTIVNTARSLWQPYGVTLAPARERGVAVIVSGRSFDRMASTGSRQVLGTTMFSDGHAEPYIHLWVAAAEALLAPAESAHAWNMPIIERDSRLVSILGVALAHELGHYLLDTTHHADAGMLQNVLALRDLQHPTPERLGLTADQQNELCSKDHTTRHLLK
jgi:hypothetical protein